MKYSENHQGPLAGLGVVVTNGRTGVSSNVATSRDKSHDAIKRRRRYSPTGRWLTMVGNLQSLAWQGDWLTMGAGG